MGHIDARDAGKEHGVRKVRANRKALNNVKSSAAQKVQPSRFDGKPTKTPPIG